jgi:hypothetical protein
MGGLDVEADLRLAGSFKISSCSHGQRIGTFGDTIQNLLREMILHLS